MEKEGIDQILSQSVAALNRAHLAARALFCRQRLLLGMKQAFDDIPRLEEIRLFFGKMPQEFSVGMSSVSRTLLTNIKCQAGDEDGSVQKKLDLSLRPVRNALGNTRDVLGDVELFFRSDNLVFTRETLERHLERLLSPELKRLGSVDLQQLDLETQTPQAPATVSRAPRL